MLWSKPGTWSSMDIHKYCSIFLASNPQKANKCPFTALYYLNCVPFDKEQNALVKKVKSIKLVLEIYYFTLHKSTHNPRIIHWPLGWETPLSIQMTSLEVNCAPLPHQKEKNKKQDCPLVVKEGPKHAADTNRW